MSSRPYAWLRPDFVPPSPFLVVKDPQTESSRILVEPHLIDAEFRKAWMPFFCRSGHPVVTPDRGLLKGRSYWYPVMLDFVVIGVLSCFNCIDS